MSTVPIISAINRNNCGRKFLKTQVNGKAINWLVDSGSDLTLISKHVAQSLSLGKLQPCSIRAQSAKGDNIKIIGKVEMTLELQEYFLNVTVYVVDQLCDDAILGINALSQFKSLQIDFNGVLPPLKVANSKAFDFEISNISDKPSVLDIEPVSLFSEAPPGPPIRTPSRYNNAENTEFIRSEIEKLLNERIIVHSESSWRSQAFVTKSSTGKKRMVVDFASTINRTTKLDAFPVPLIANVLRQLEGSCVFSRVDLRAAYHQVPLRKDHQHFTAFEADGQLFEFTRLPFGVTNGVPIFLPSNDEYNIGFKRSCPLF